MKKKIIFYVIAIILISPLSVFCGNSDQHLLIMESFDIYGKAVKNIFENYIDDIKIEKLLQNSIEGMLSQLDPYSEYYDIGTDNNLNILISGCYVGYGFTVQNINNNLTLTYIRENTPAYNIGLKVGDIFYAIDSEVVVNRKDITGIFENKKLPTLFRVIRNGISDTLNFTINKDTINVPTVSFSKIFNNNIGYIKLEQFAVTSYDELSKAFYSLWEQKILKGLIIDLRGNHGGLMQQAINICNMFVPYNSLIISSIGRSKSRQYRATSYPIDATIPLIVLIDDESASASEIVAGCLQDLDRALIVGTPSFGKGLVQEVYELGYSKSMKFTIAKYYTPSGRCIQKVDYSKKDTVSSKTSDITKEDSGVPDNNENIDISDDSNNDTIPDSSRVFYTKNGRKVFEKKGIYPDLVVKDDTLKSSLVSLLTKNYILFDFATQYCNKNAVTKSNYKMNDSIYKIFIEYVINSDAFRKLENIVALDAISKKEVSEASKLIIGNTINSLLAEYKRVLQDDKTCKTELMTKLDNNIKYRILTDKEYAEEILIEDKVFKQALDIFENGTYSKLLYTGVNKPDNIQIKTKSKKNK